MAGSHSIHTGGTRFGYFVVITMAIASTCTVAFDYVAGTLSASYGYFAGRMQSFAARVVEAFKRERLEFPAQVHLVQACAHAMRIARRENLTVRQGSWRMCPSI